MTDELHALRISQYQALRDGAGLVDRSPRGILRLSGADRRAYLQGLLTNDIVALGAGQGCYAAYLTAQGRMISDMRVFETGEAIVMDLEAPVAAAIAGRLSQFIFSEEVEVADISADSAVTGVYGPLAAGVVAMATGLAAAELEAMPLYANRRADPALVVRSDDIGVMGFDLIVPAASKDDTTGQLIEAGATEVAADVADASRIDAGRPRFLIDMTDDTIPLEAGIEDRAISLTKGCYVGQEVIVRVLHRGHGRVARRLVRLAFDGPDVPAAGDAIGADDKEIGHVTSAALSPATGRAVALGYVSRDLASAGTRVNVRGGGPHRLPATVERQLRLS
jgi:folate-binding protein YgfZ